MAQTIFFKVRISIRYSSKPTYNLSDTLLVRTDSIKELDRILDEYAEETNSFFDILSIEVISSPRENPMYNPMPF